MKLDDIDESCLAFPEVPTTIQKFVDEHKIAVGVKFKTPSGFLYEFKAPVIGTFESTLKTQNLLCIKRVSPLNWEKDSALFDTSQINEAFADMLDVPKEERQKRSHNYYISGDSLLELIEKNDLQFLLI